MKEWLVSYLSFSRKERTGIIVLLVLIFSVWLLPEFFVPDQKLTGKQQAKADSIVKLAKAVPKRFRLFYFDPNTIADSGWLELGLSEKNIKTIRNYLNKGGHFHEPTDISRIYGLNQERVEQLIPYIRIEEDVRRVSRNTYPSRYKNYTAYRFANRPPPKTFPPRKTGMQVEINGADSSALEALPGIGAKLAARIVKFREALGGFYKVEQLAEVYGIHDSVFQIFRPYLLSNTGIYRRVRINHWEVDSLDLHPYIQKHEAKAIVNFRKQHGAFREPEDLNKINILSSAWISKLSPYLSFD